MISCKMMSNLNIFSYKMQNRILSEINDTSIVTSKWDVIKKYYIIFQLLFHLRILSTTTVYSAFIVEKVTQTCFLECHETKDILTNNLC